MKSTNVTWHDGAVNKDDRRKKFGQRSFVIWFTGLSGSGKSTVSVALEKALFTNGNNVYRLDGDNIRHGLNSNLGFGPEDRTENIRRIGEVSKLFVDAGLITLTAFISPYREDRNSVRELVAPDEFIEVYVKCSLEECEKRDAKGLYAKVRSGEISEFTGISSPYEEPTQPEICIDTEHMSIEESVNHIISELTHKGYLET